jgi:Transglycosylase SLT domain
MPFIVILSLFKTKSGHNYFITMTKRNRSVSLVFSSCLLLIVLCGFAPAKAQRIKDTAKKIVLAAADKKATGSYVAKEANVVYPDLLCGAEENSVEYIEKFSANRREYLMRMYKKGKSFFPKAVTILRKHRLPDEYKVLLALESAFNGNAVSKAGAVGYWQIMDEVAREYGLKYEPQLSAAEKRKLENEQKKELLKKSAKAKTPKKPAVKDDRKNFIKSTYAAARYLRDRTRNLDNDPLLVVASYNCGVGNVWEAMKKTGLSNPDFWDVKNYLPAETRSYVMNFIALNVIFHNYDKFINNTLNFKDITIKAENIETNVSAAMPASLNDY